MEPGRKVSPNHSLIWPWKNLTVDQYHDMYDNSAAASGNFRFTRLIITNVFFVFGLIGNLCVLITVFYAKRVARASNVFYTVIAAVAVFDFMFVTFSFSRRYVREDPSLPALIYYCIACALAASSTQMSGMLTLSLAIDRLLAVACPIAYHSEDRRFRICTWTCLILVSSVISLTRLRFAVDNFHYRNPHFAGHMWFDTLGYATDVIVPFVIAGILVTVVIAICALMLKRNKVQAHQTLSRTSSLDEVNRKTKQHFSLFVVLLCMYFLNQIGYITYSCLYLRHGEFSLTYSSSLTEIRHYVAVNLWFEGANMLADLLESLSRSMTFYAYVLFNGCFCMHFIKALSSLVEAVLYCKRDDS